MRPRSVLAPTCLLLLLLGDVAAADCPFEPAGGIIHACAHKRTGLLRCITAGEACRKTERLLTWTVQSPPDARGTQGAPGLARPRDVLDPESAPGVPISGVTASGAVRGQLAFCDDGVVEDLDVYIPGTSFHAITDAAGRFVLSYVPIGVHELKVRKGGVAIGSVPAVQVLDTQVTDVGTVQLTALDTTQNCGTCGNTCISPNTCVDGTCTLVCPEGMARCGDACVTLATDEENCGQCGNACGPPPANAVRDCKNGTCSFACQSSYADCDGNAANGCEANIASELHCGSCGAACAAVPNGRKQCYFSCGGTPFLNYSCGHSCSSGAYIVCDPGYGNCDGDNANGCETSLRVNGNCGGCGITCTFGMTCSAKGRCEDRTDR